MSRTIVRCWVCNAIVWDPAGVETVCYQCGRNHVAAGIREARAMGDRALARSIRDSFLPPLKQPEDRDPPPSRS